MTFNKLFSVALAAFGFLSFASAAHANCYGTMYNLSKTETVTLKMISGSGNIYTGTNYCNVQSTADGTMICTLGPGAKFSYEFSHTKGNTAVNVWIGLGPKSNVTYSSKPSAINIGYYKPSFTCLGMAFAGPLCVTASGTKACLSFIAASGKNSQFNITTSGTK